MNRRWGETVELKEGDKMLVVPVINYKFYIYRIIINEFKNQRKCFEVIYSLNISMNGILKMNRHIEDD